MIRDLKTYTNFLKDKKILIFGLGLQGGGVGAAKFMARFGRKVRVTDLKTKEELQNSLDKLKDFNLDYTLGGHNKQDIEWADILLVNQDVWNKNLDSEYIKYARELNKILETEASLFFQLCACPIIGITGSRGKTTTTIALGQMLKKAGFKILLAGNIPESQTLNELDQTSNLDYAVLELSNFQLHSLHNKKLSPNIAIITSISPDHLLSYGDMSDYLADKKAIFTYQKPDDYLFLKQNGKYVAEFRQETKSQIKYFSAQSIPVDWDLKILGQHNQENLGAVYEVGQILKLNQELMRDFLINFKGVPFRMEEIGEIGGIRFINDTTATTPTAAQIALKSLSKGKIIWLAGGNSKKLPQQDLVKTACEQVKKIVFLDGTGTAAFKNDLKKECQDWPKLDSGTFDNFGKAIDKAFSLAESGDIILLSPGFTSFGMFANEFDRGRQFNEHIKKLTKIS